MILLMTSVAWAYHWGVSITGTEGHYHIVPSDFPTGLDDTIELGASAWNAGSGEVVRGAEFEWVRDSDVGAGALGNTRNEVFMRDQDWFNSHGIGGCFAFTFPGSLGDVDIIFNDDVSWCGSRPSECSSGTLSIAQVATHEFGYRIGFYHEDDTIATMNTHYPNGGDLGTTNHRINEDDYAGLADHKSGSSTGTDLLLSKFNEDGSGDAIEVWTTNFLFDKSADEWVGAVPDPILAVVEGTETDTSLIEWRLSPDSTCFAGVEYVIGTQTVSMTSNTVVPISPDAWNLGYGVPTTYYYLCARIDADAAITETSETDNTVRSEGTAQVRP